MHYESKDRRSKADLWIFRAAIGFVVPYINSNPISQIGPCVRASHLKHPNLMQAQFCFDRFGRMFDMGLLKKTSNPITHGNDTIFWARSCGSPCVGQIRNQLS